MKQTTKQLLRVACIALGASLAAPGWGQSHDAHHQTAQANPGAKTMTDAVDAEVRRVDKAAGKITLRHGELKQLDMPPMTMVFEVKDKAMLDGVKPGDKVKFKAIDDNGKLLVTEIKPAS